MGDFDLKVLRSLLEAAGEDRTPLEAPMPESPDEILDAYLSEHAEEIVAHLSRLARVARPLRDLVDLEDEAERYYREHHTVPSHYGQERDELLGELVRAWRGS